MINQNKTGTFLVLGAAILGAFILAAYAYVYQNTPFSGNWNDITTSWLAVIAALMAAFAIWLVYRCYRPGDTPRPIWLNFMLGIWMWAASEVIWYTMFLTSYSVATPSVADLGWFAGYIFFTIAFYKQYIAFFHIQPSQARRVAVSLWIGAIAAGWLLSLLFGQSSWAAFVDYFYPVGDYLIGILAAHTLWKFRGGALARPWMGLLLFTISDTAYAILVQTGLYAWSVETGNILTLAVDITYVAAYLVLAISFLGQYTLVRYGAYPLPPQD